jgi:hypothetical protein
MRISDHLLENALKTSSKNRWSNVRKSLIIYFVIRLMTGASRTHKIRRFFCGEA